MLTRLLLLAFLAAPFWEATAPADWTDQQLYELLHRSPWARHAEGTTVYLATARPMREAEQELRRRNASPPGETEDPMADDYSAFLQDYPGQYIVVAAQLQRPEFLERPEELRRMEENSFLVVRKERHGLVGHFPPTPGDPYLRLVFPRAVRRTDRLFYFDLYLPGVRKPFRRLVFDVGELSYRGRLEL